MAILRNSTHVSSETLDIFWFVLSITVLKNKQMSVTQRQGTINAFQRKANPNTSWRTGDLVNTAYRITFSFITVRLTVMLPKFIQDDVKRLIKGRYIYDVLLYVETKKCACSAAYGPFWKSLRQCLADLYSKGSISLTLTQTLNNVLRRFRQIPVFWSVLMDTVPVGLTIR